MQPMLQQKQLNLTRRSSKARLSNRKLKCMQSTAALSQSQILTTSWAHKLQRKWPSAWKIATGLLCRHRCLKKTTQRTVLASTYRCLRIDSLSPTLTRLQSTRSRMIRICLTRLRTARVESWCMAKTQTCHFTLVHRMQRSKPRHKSELMRDSQVQSSNQTKDKSSS